jgi:hypothetical protein
LNAIRLVFDKVVDEFSTAVRSGFFVFLSGFRRLQKEKQQEAAAKVQ